MAGLPWIVFLGSQAILILQCTSQQHKGQHNYAALQGRVAPVEGSNSQFTVSWKGAANQWGKDTGAVSLACSMAD